MLFVHRDEVALPTPTGEPDTAKIIIARQRHGPLGEVEVAFDREHATFSDLDANWQPVPPDEAPQ